MIHAKHHQLLQSFQKLSLYHKFRIDLLQSVFYCFVFRKRVPGEMIRHMNVSGFEHSWCLRQKQAC